MIENILLSCMRLYFYQIVSFFVIGLMLFIVADMESVNKHMNLGFKIIFIPFYIVFKLPYEIIKKILSIKTEKQEKEKQKYQESLKKLKSMYNKNIYQFPSLSNIINKYSKILENDFHKDIAFNRIEYIITFINECEKSNILNDTEVRYEITEAIKSVEELLMKIIEEVEDISNKANAELKEYIINRTKDLKNSTDAILETFKQGGK